MLEFEHQPQIHQLEIKKSHHSLEKKSPSMLLETFKSLQCNFEKEAIFSRFHDTNFLRFFSLCYTLAKNIHFFHTNFTHPPKEYKCGLEFSKKCMLFWNFNAPDCLSSWTMPASLSLNCLKNISTIHTPHPGRKVWKKFKSKQQQAKLTKFEI